MNEIVNNFTEQLSLLLLRNGTSLHTEHCLCGLFGGKSCPEIRQVINIIETCGIAASMANLEGNVVDARWHAKYRNLGFS
ncbi:hypothetical protein AHF37_12711 [Paragonimus kellicotti]|nr:hypothetical protein AHF37_12711 [Paragonimus kellicotti]